MDARKTTIILLFLFAFGLLLVAFFYPIPVAEDEDIEAFIERQTVLAPTIEPEPLMAETKAWTTSREHFAIEIPEDWEVEQSDAGGMSVITIVDPENVDTELSIRLGLTSSLDGDPVSLQEFINIQLLEADLIEDCDVDMLGGEEVECYIATFEEGVRDVYFGKIDALTYFYIAKDHEEKRVTSMQDVLQSIDFDPTDEVLEEAEVIK